MPFVFVEKLVEQYKLPDEKPSLETLICTLSFQVVKQPIHFMNNDVFNKYKDTYEVMYPPHR